MVLGKQLNIYLLIASLVFFALWTSKSSTSGGGGQAAPVLTNVSANFIGSNGTVNLPLLDIDSGIFPTPTDCGTSANPAQIVLTFEGPENCQFFMYYTVESLQPDGESYMNNFVQGAPVPGPEGKYLYTITAFANSLPLGTAVFSVIYVVSIRSGGGGHSGQPLSFSALTPIQIDFSFESTS
jgi:hypothetical protein